MALKSRATTIIVFIICVFIVVVFCTTWVARGLLFPSSISPKMNVLSVSYLNNNTNAYDDVFLSRGDYYVGGFKNTLYSGKGKYYFDNGDGYFGEFQDATYHGYGKYVFADKSYFTGIWNNNLRHGPGLAVLSNGDVFYGNWVKDHVTGIGYYYRPYHDTKAYTMFFRNDIRYYQFETNDNNKQLEYSSLTNFDYSRYSDIISTIQYKAPDCSLLYKDSCEVSIRIPRKGSKLFYDTFKGYFYSKSSRFVGNYHYFNDCFYRGSIVDSLLTGRGEYYFSDSVKLEAEWKIKSWRGRNKSVMTPFSKKYDIQPGIVDYAKIGGSSIRGYQKRKYKHYKIYQPSSIIGLDSVMIKFKNRSKRGMSTFYGKLDMNYNYSLGMYLFANGDSYYGNFKDGKYADYGEYIWGDNSKMYSGNWRDGKFHGLGILFLRQKDKITVIEALWDHGYLCRVFFVFFDEPGKRLDVEDFVHTIRRDPLFPPPLRFKTHNNG